MKRIFLGALAVVALTCGGVGLVMAVGDPNAKSSGYEIPDAGPPVALKTQPPKASPRPQTIREGTHRVGVDVKPGKYKTSGAVEGLVQLCYWDVRKGSETGEIVAQGVKDQPGASGYVTLKNGQFFTTNGCENWTVAK